MEAEERDAVAVSGSDSDATRVNESDSGSSDEDIGEALPNAPALADGDAVFVPIQLPTEAVVDLADDDEEAEFELPPLAPAGREDASDSDETLPVGLAGGDSDDEPLAAAPSASKKRKRLRQAESDPVKPDPMKQPAPTVIIKPQPTECTVCYDPCTLSGRHRLVSLKCGHVFGKKCIDRWVIERRTCPNCSVTVRKADIRPLFTDHVAVVDNSGLEDMAQKCEAEKSRRIHIETELSRTKLQLQLAQAEALKFQHEAAQWRKQVANLQCRAASERFTATMAAATSTQPSQLMETQVLLTPTKPAAASPFSQGGFFADGPPSTPSAREVPAPATPSTPSADASSSAWNYREQFRYRLQSSRVCAISSSCALACVGEALTPTSFGIVKLSTYDTRHAVRIAAHASAIRDLAISPRDDLVLSAAFDGKLAVTNLMSDSVVMQFALPPTKRNAWSCAFSQLNPSAVFCGFHDGTIAQYDLRRPASGGGAMVALYELPARQPVHSIQVWPVLSSGIEQLVAGTFSGFGVWGSDKLRQPSPSDVGTTVSSFVAAPNCSALASSQTRRRKLLVTTRAQPPSVPAKHSIYELPTVLSGANPASLRCELQGFRTPQAISRAAIWDANDGNTVAASWDDALKTVNLWDVATQFVKKRFVIPGQAGQAPVVDVQHSVANGDWRRSRALLGVLSPQQLTVFRYAS